MTTFYNASRAPYSFYALNEAGKSVRLTAEPGRSVEVPDGFEVNQSPMFKHAIASGRLTEGEAAPKLDDQEVVDKLIQNQADERRKADEELAKSLVAGINGGKTDDASAADESDEPVAKQTAAKPAATKPAATKKDDE